MTLKLGQRIFHDEFIDAMNQVTALIWELNGIQYNLLSYSDVVSLAELTEMAKSVR